MFKIRTKKPTSTKHYITRGNGGWSWCIQGYPKDSQCDVLANCVGYACGRFNEVYNEIKGTTGMKYYALNCNAENFVTRAKSTYGLEVVNYPVKGGIMVWEGAGSLAGHVAFVEKVHSSNHIYTSESGYGGSAFWNSHRYNDNGRWGLGSNYKFIGCIVNPAVGKVTTESDPAPATKPSTGKFKVGDKVVLNGYLYRDAMGNGKGAKKTNYKGIVKIVYANGTKPYHIDSLGWVAESDIKSQSSSASSTSRTFKVGDKIVLTGHVYRDSMGNGRGAYKQNYRGTITIINSKGTKPYHIDKIGWVSAGNVTLR